MATVVIVGGGLAGLAAAARLARQRHDVTLLDRGALGGPTSGDGAPASFTMPAVYRDLFRKTGRPLETDVPLVPVEPARRYSFPDGRVLDLPTGSRAAMLDAFGRGLGPTAAAEWDQVVGRGGEAWARLRPRLVPEGEAASVVAEPAPAHVHVRDPACRLLLGWYANDAGADPTRHPADVTVLPYLEQAFGAWTVDGGIAALVRATAARAQTCGAVLHTGTDVTTVLVQRSSVTGVRTKDGSSIGADVVVDTTGLPVEGQPPPGARAQVWTQVTVRLQCSEPPDLPAETVVLRGGADGAIAVIRPDAAGAPRTVVVRRTYREELRDDRTTADRLLADLAAAGITLQGEVIDRGAARITAPVRPRRWRGAGGAGWLDLRARATDPHVTGLLLARPAVRGAFAVPWQGLAAALAASACGTVPRRPTP